MQILPKGDMPVLFQKEMNLLIFIFIAFLGLFHKLFKKFIFSKIVFLSSLLKIKDLIGFIIDCALEAFFVRDSCPCSVDLN